MSRARSKMVTIVGILCLALAAGMLLAPVVHLGVSTITAGIVVGVLGALCLVGVAFGVWDARRIEARRKAKEQIWIKH